MAVARRPILSPGRAPLRLALTTAGDGGGPRRCRRAALPYLTEFCLFAAAFIAAYNYGDRLLQRLRASRAGVITRCLARWRRKPDGRWRRF